MSAENSSHWAKSKEPSQEEDRVETLIKNSGCWDQHIAVVDCMGENGDWRKCQETLGNFRTCMTKGYHEKQQKEQKAVEKK